MTGCGAGLVATTTQTNPTSYSGVAFSGKVLAGNVPVNTSSVQLYAAGSTGVTSAATALLATPITTTATGAFNVPAGYTCPASTSQLYLVAQGGNIGSSAANSAIIFFTPIGECGQLAAASSFVLNEVTTTASAYALAQFLSSGTNLAASATNAQGLINAVATAASLANLTTGTAPGAAFPANGTAPTARINTLANLLNSCAASTAGNAASSPCGKLFASTTIGASAPANTFAAALNIVRAPASNVSALLTQAATATTFAPALALATAPTDWTLHITYTGGGMNEPSGIGVDSSGNIWVANYAGVASEFSPLGKPFTSTGITGSGLNASYGLAVDASSNIWIPNEESSGSVNSGLGTVTEFNSAGQPTSGTTGFAAGGLNYPVAVAIDTNTNVWVVDYGNSHVTLLSSAGQPLSGATGYASPSSAGTDAMAFPVSIAVDASHNAWVGDQNDSAVTRITTSGQLTSYQCCNGPASLAVDQSGNVWVANFYGDSVTELSSAGAVLTTSAGGGIYHPQGVAIDGSGSIWVTNYRATGLSQLAASTSSTPGKILSPATGWAPDAALLEAYSLAIDASGNIWVTSFGNNTLTEYIGLAAPVKTPLVGPPNTP